MMTSHNRIFLAVAIVLLVGGIAAFAFHRNDAVVVPDTGTTGTTPPVIVPTTVTAKVGQTISMFGASGRVLSVEEDSRCPSDVQCVWAGTVRVKVRASYGSLTKDVILSLESPYELNGHSVTLAEVQPQKVSTIPISSSDYVFTFKID